MQAFILTVPTQHAASAPDYVLPYIEFVRQNPNCTEAQCAAFGTMRYPGFFTEQPIIDYVKQGQSVKGPIGSIGRQLSEDEYQQLVDWGSQRGLSTDTIPAYRKTHAHHVFLVP